VLLTVPPVIAADPPPAITDYRPLFQPVQDRAGRQLVAIRSFRQGAIPSCLVVDPATFATAVLPADSLSNAPAAAGTPYGRALERFTAPPYRLQNHGATRAPRPVVGVSLTVDLCPSGRPFERELFSRLGRFATRDGQPVPVAIAITGLWLERHGAELAWLVEESRQGRLAITWVNHSDHHPYDAGLPLDRTFLLTAGVDPARELLALERKLLARGIVPSPFVRFPGLVADSRVIATARDLGLIPLGSDAWLAKGEVPRDGSFILVHGNGNEPRGIEKFLAYLDRQPTARFLSLAANFTGE
jgi:hypothetical protein